jgi:hypothetical protein
MQAAEAHHTPGAGFPNSADAGKKPSMAIGMINERMVWKLLEKIDLGYCPNDVRQSNIS